MIEKLQKLVARFEKAQEKYSEVGAGDTEPDGIFQNILVRSFQKKDYNIPLCAERWQLYASEPQANQAAKRLSKLAQQCVALINEEVAGCYTGPLEQYLRSYCWRVDW